MTIQEAPSGSVLAKRKLSLELKSDEVRLAHVERRS
jgi:hypothetical protein